VALQFSKPLTEPDEALDFRLQVARELHDQVASPLVTLIIELHELRAETGQDADTSQRLATMEEAARQALRQTREMVVDMRGQEVLRLGFASVLREEVLGRFDPKASISLHVSPDWPDRINGWSAFNLSRIVHEAVTNAVRHGHARSITVALDVTADGEAVVEIIDDGEGFDGMTGLGIAGMRERAVILGGTFSVCTGESSGIRVEVRIPKYRLE
jgi:signal transduction histidine kinase